MKKRGLMTIFLSLVMLSGVFTFAQETVTQEQFLTKYLQLLLPQAVPPPAKYIQVYYQNIPSPATKRLLQEAIFLGKLPNAKVVLDRDAPISQRQVAGWIAIVQKKEISYTQDTLADAQRIQSTLEALPTLPTIIELHPQPGGQKIFNEVLQVLEEDYADAKQLSGTQLRYGAIKGLVGATQDPHTNFFTPQEAKQFTDELAGELQGIGAYVEMKTPGIVTILDTIVGSPANKAGLQSKDIFLQVDEHIVQTGTSLQTVISWIKGPAETQVHIFVLRGQKKLEFTLTRKKITIPDMETKIFTGGKCYIAIRSFDAAISTNFTKIMQGDFGSAHCTRYIFDLRNNPGGSLQEVLNILNFIVPTGKSSAQVGSQQSTTRYLSRPVSGTKITDKPMFFLINGGSASASEIFVATAKEYAPQAKIIGQKSYGKGTVQTMLSYPDGSLLKYTIAKRYTGKDKKNIDKVGISPDVELEDLASTPQDELLEYALK